MQAFLVTYIAKHITGTITLNIAALYITALHIAPLHIARHYILL